MNTKFSGRPVEKPVTTLKPGIGRDFEEVTTHPAYAQIGAYRVSGGANLYDSDFQHNAYMTIRIKRSELHRHLNRDWHFGKEEIMEVALSEAQWATFVSSPNMGDGVPCTLQREDGRIIPALPAPESRTKQFSSEMRADLAEAESGIREALSEVDALGLPKGKAATVKNAMQRVLHVLNEHVPFVVRQFDEHVEGSVEKAKAEIHGYMTNVITRAGLDALAGGSLPLQIESREGEE